MQACLSRYNSDYYSTTVAAGRAIDSPCCHVHGTASTRGPRRVYAKGGYHARRAPCGKRGPGTWAGGEAEHNRAIDSSAERPAAAWRAGGHMRAQMLAMHWQPVNGPHGRLRARPHVAKLISWKSTPLALPGFVPSRCEPVLHVTSEKLPSCLSRTWSNSLAVPGVPLLNARLSPGACVSRGGRGGGVFSAGTLSTLHVL